MDDYLHAARTQRLAYRQAATPQLEVVLGDSQQVGPKVQKPQQDQQVPLEQHAVTEGPQPEVQRDPPLQCRIAGGFESWHQSKHTKPQVLRGPKPPARQRRRPQTAHTRLPVVLPHTAIQTRKKDLHAQRLADQYTWGRRKTQATKGIIGGYQWDARSQKKSERAKSHSRLHPSQQLTIDELRSIFREAKMPTSYGATSYGGKRIPYYAMLEALPLARQKIQAETASEYFPVKPYICPRVLEFFQN